MRDELLTYYERELTFLRRMGAEFAEKYPRIAGRLQLERDKCEDPHVERLIEAVAFLAARVHLKLDDEFPEIAESVLQVLYPHFLAPVPSMTVVQFAVDPARGKLSTGQTLPRHRALFSKPTNETICRFRTCYPVTLWPIDVRSAEVQRSQYVDASGRSAPGAIVVRLETQGGALFRELSVDRLRFYLQGEAQLTYRLYELLFSGRRRVELRNPSADNAAVALPDDALQPVGFSADEGLLPYSSRSFLGYRLVQEYFGFPEKFLFVDVRGLTALRDAGFGQSADLVFVLDRVPPADLTPDAGTFRLGCTPAVNLFTQTAEPILLDQAHTEYRVIPDLRRERVTEVYSIDGVTSVSPRTGDTLEFQPFYSFRHSFEGRQEHAFWHAMRRSSARKDDAGTDVFLTLVDLDFRPTRPATDVLIVSTTCTNRDLPALLPFGDPGGDFFVEDAAAVSRVVCLTKPTRTVRAPLRHRAQWRLISHLSLNYLSPAGNQTAHSPEVLQEILRLYDFEDSPVVQQQIAGVTGVSSRQVLRRIRTEQGTGFARGLEATLEFDESRFVGSGVFLFASVLEWFLALSVSINSFSETVAVSRQRGVLHRWPPRSGQQALL